MHPENHSPISSPEEALRAFREFARTTLLGHDEEFDSGAEPPLELYRPLHKQGLLNWWLPTEYGGAGLGLADSVDIVSELAYADAGSAFTLLISVLSSSMVSLYGSPELKEEFLTAMTRDGGYSAALGSEREAGSELINLTTTLTRRGDHVVLNGEKMFSTNSGFADYLIVFAKSAGEREKGASYHAVLVPRGTPGARVVKRWDMIGLRSAGTYQVSFTDCAVPSGNVLNGPGLKIIEVGLNSSRILIGAIALGVARRIRDICLDYAITKPLGGHKLIENAVFASKIGQMEMQIEVMRNQCLAAAREYDDVMAMPDPPAEFLRRGALRSALTTKMFCGQTGWQIATVGSEMFGGLGYTTDLPISKYLRDIRAVTIVEAGDDVLRELVFRRFVLPPNRRI
ncbi:acyl-CoA/acyl-ACP dehydrogenase [Streptomyces sp. NA02950]|uniref:acyl-CoA dehydrogenase family protein n=1 Tax=Streptomyces sp. NA02950 TaxID=2742137 RepID=UPI0015910419|nr:acyl-CoA dehydrogenase family protein [Streptomyces sp. NA02950]QKV96178.1 acyl-CoA/acyl-ACP dehydrogenase [Streptomyces sp. NA02950]